MYSVSEHAEHSEQCSVYSVVKTTEYTDSVYTRALYYEVPWTSYTGLAPGRVVTLYFCAVIKTSSTTLSIILQLN